MDQLRQARKIAVLQLEKIKKLAALQAKLEMREDEIRVLQQEIKELQAFKKLYEHLASLILKNESSRP